MSTAVETDEMTFRGKGKRVHEGKVATFAEAPYFDTIDPVIGPLRGITEPTDTRISG
jgi:hypothetical protein